MKSNLSVHLSYDPLSLFLPLYFYVSLYLSTHILSFSSLSMRLTSHPHSLFYLFIFLSSSHLLLFLPPSLCLSFSHPLSLSHIYISPFISLPLLFCSSHILSLSPSLKATSLALPLSLLFPFTSKASVREHFWRPSGSSPVPPRHWTYYILHLLRLSPWSILLYRLRVTTISLARCLLRLVFYDSVHMPVFPCIIYFHFLVIFARHLWKIIVKSFSICLSSFLLACLDAYFHVYLFIYLNACLSLYTHWRHKAKLETLAI